MVTGEESTYQKERWVKKSTMVQINQLVIVLKLEILTEYINQKHKPNALITQRMCYCYVISPPYCF